MTWGLQQFKGSEVLKQFLLGLVVALVCGSTATAEYAEYASWSCKGSTARYTIFTEQMVSVDPQGLVFKSTCKTGFCVSMRYDSELKQDRVSTTQILYEKSEDDSIVRKPKELMHNFFVRLEDDTINIGRVNNLIEPLNCEKY